jgi:hypothetical protein
VSDALETGELVPHLRAEVGRSNVFIHRKERSSPDAHQAQNRALRRRHVRPAPDQRLHEAAAEPDGARTQREGLRVRAARRPVHRQGARGHGQLGLLRPDGGDAALREEPFRWHTEFLSKHEDKFILPTILPETETTWLCYPIQLRPATGCSQRKLQIQLEDSGIMSRVIFSGNITRHPMLKGHEYRVQSDGLATCD